MILNKSIIVMDALVLIHSFALLKPWPSFHSTQQSAGSLILGNLLPILDRF
jgi:hypothetical protein